MRTLAQLRYALLIPLAFAALSVPRPFAQTEVIIRQAPPAERVEVIPAERPGYAWDRGHWKWQRGA
ncbi:hypothetical protein D0N73_26885, partial [Pseudomonas fluorescens]